MNTRDKQLSPQQFDEIKRLYREVGLNQYEIAEIYGVTQSHISRVIRGIAVSYHKLVVTKLKRLNKNITPKSSEPSQAYILRGRREKLHSTKLNWAQACRIRELYFSGKKSQWQLARMYGINQCTVSLIIQGATWKINV